MAIIENFSSAPDSMEDKNLIFRRFLLLKQKEMAILRDFCYLSLL